MKLDMKTELKRYVLLTAGALIMAIGNYFFKFTNNFTFGGITGLSVLVSKTGIISASDFNFIANMALLLLGLIIYYMVLMFRKNKISFYLFIPYLLWTIFATYLTIGVYLLN